MTFAVNLKTFHRENDLNVRIMVTMGLQVCYQTWLPKHHLVPWLLPYGQINCFGDIWVLYCFEYKHPPWSTYLKMWTLVLQFMALLGEVTEPVGGGALLEEAHHWGWGLESTQPCPTSHLLCFVCGWRWELSAFFRCQAFPPLQTPPFEIITPNKLYLL